MRHSRPKRKISHTTSISVCLAHFSAVVNNCHLRPPSGPAMPATNWPIHVAVCVTYRFRNASPNSQHRIHGFLLHAAAAVNAQRHETLICPPRSPRTISRPASDSCRSRARCRPKREKRTDRRTVQRFRRAGGRGIPRKKYRMWSLRTPRVAEVCKLAAVGGFLRRTRVALRRCFGKKTRRECNYCVITEIPTRQKCRKWDTCSTY